MTRALTRDEAAALLRRLHDVQSGVDAGGLRAAGRRGDSAPRLPPNGESPAVAGLSLVVADLTPR